MTQMGAPTHTPLYKETETLKSGASKEFQFPPGYRISVSQCGQVEGAEEQRKRKRKGKKEREKKRRRGKRKREREKPPGLRL